MKSSPLAIALLAVFLSLGLCELAARLFFHPTLTERVEIVDPAGKVGGDCYPRAPGVHLPLDIATERDAETFFGRVIRARSAWPVEEEGLRVLMAQDIPMHLSYFRLIREAPLCVVYDLSDTSPRRIVSPPGFRETILLLGDSFAFGQGVTDEETFTARLATKLHARIRSYAAKGANIPQIETQFEQALKEAKGLGVRRFLYVYVLNDPAIASDMKSRLNVINDLMNVRPSGAGISESGELRLLARYAKHSALLRFALRVYSTREVTGETIRWYNEAHDPALNRGITNTFERLQRLRDRAKKQGIELDVAVYPMMLDMKEYPLLEAHRHLAELARQYGIALHDLLPAFQRHAGESLTVHPIDMHPNGPAHEIAATETAEWLSIERPRASALPSR